MALFGNPIVYGLTQENNLEDVVDTFSALNNITLNPYDLGYFAGVGRYLNNSTVHILNNTNENLKVTYNRLKSDAARHQDVLNLGMNITDINGNITVYGPVAAKSISYYDLDKYDPNTGFIVQEASTSNGSIWSPLSTTIQYPNDLIITSGTSISAKGLKFTNAVKRVNFPRSDVATHTLEISANGKRFLLYLTKDIPYILPPTGTSPSIQNIDITVGILSTNIPLSYTINEVPNDGIARVLDSNQYYIDGSEVTKSIKYNSGSSDKYIELYTSPGNFNILEIPGLKLSKLPLIILRNLETLNIRNNNFTTLPNLSTLTPAVSTLTLDNQVGGLPGNVDSTFISKLPPNLKYLSMGSNAFNSGIHRFQPYDILDVFPLQTLKIGFGNFRDTCPSVSESCTSYEVQSNSFSALPATGLFRPTATNNITNLNFERNTELALSPTTSATYMSGDYYSDSLATFNILNTKLPIPDLRNKTALKTFSMDGSLLNNSISMPASTFSLTNSDGVYKFDGCTSLTDITLNNMAASFAGILPNITSSVVNLTFNNVSFTGAQSSVQEDGSTNIYGLYKNTLIGCSQTLKSFFYTSTYDPGYALSVEPGLFDTFSKLETLTIRTRNLSGALPKLTRCPLLKTIDIRYNGVGAGGFNELTPLDNSATRTLQAVNMSYNALSGTLNTNLFFKNGTFDKLVTLDFNHNYFDTLIIDSSVLKLNTINFSFNKLTDIPDFSATKVIKTIDLSNNNISGYPLSAFSKITFTQGSPVSINLSNNKLSAAAVSDIIKDLYTATKSISTIAQFTLDLRYQPFPLNLTGATTEYSKLTTFEGVKITL